MTEVSETADTRVIARAGLWSALAFTLNLVWEIAHVRLYTLWDAADRMTIAWSVLHCSLGDVVIALSFFALAGFALRQRTGRYSGRLPAAQSSSSARWLSRC